MRRSFAPLSASLIAVVSLLCGFMHAAPWAGRLPSTAALASAARGLDQNGSVRVSLLMRWCDSINAWLWESGGASRLGTGQWLSVFLTWTIVAGFVLFGVWLLIRIFCFRHGRFILAAVTVALLLTGLPPAFSFFQERDSHITTLQLVAPVALISEVQELEASTIFANDEARAALRLFSPEMANIVAPTDPKLVNDPKAWRQALRENKWESVLLTGPISKYRILLDHLLTSPDWRIARVTNQGHLFIRGPGTPLSTLEIDAISLSSKQETALYLAQLSSRLDAVHRIPDAKAAMDRALALDSKNVDVQSYAATLAAAHKKWHAAAAHATAALEADPNAAQPRMIRTLAELETGELTEAHDDISRILKRNPDDPYSLFLMARISRARSDYVTEVEALENLVDLTSRTGQPVIHYQIYLAQAYAKLGRNQDAIKTYGAVLDQGHLNPDQTTAIEEAITAISTSDAAEK